MMLQAMQRARAILLFAVLVAACGEDAVDPGPGPGPKANQPVYDLLRHLVSNPVSVSTAAGGNSAAAAEDTVAYVSLPPETYPDGVAADIRNAANGYEMSVTLENGGFDPVAVPGAVSDTLFISISDSSGTIIGFEQAIVPPETPPLIVRTRPGKGEVDVPFNLLNVTVVFSEPIDQSTVTAQTIQLRQGGADGVLLAGNVVLQDNGFVADFTPSTPLEPGTGYTLVVTTGIRDLSGDALPNQEAVSFETLGIVAYVVFHQTSITEDQRWRMTGRTVTIPQERVAVIETKTHTLTKTIDFFTGDGQWSWETDVTFIPNRSVAYLSGGNRGMTAWGGPILVDVIDAAIHEGVDPILAIDGGSLMTASADGRFAYVVRDNGATCLASVAVVSTDIHEMIALIPVVGESDWCTRVYALTVSPDGSIVYAAISQLHPDRWYLVDAEKYFTIEVIDAATNAVVASRRLPGPVSRIQFSPDGAFAYATNVELWDGELWVDEDQSRIYVIDTADLDIVATIETGRRGEEIVLTPDGTYLLVSGEDRGITVIETATNSVVDQIGGVRASAMLFSPDGSRLYAADPWSRSLWVVDVGSMGIVAEVAVDTRPWSELESLLAVTPDGAFIYMTQAGSSTVMVIDTATNTVVAEIDVGWPIKDMAITPGR